MTTETYTSTETGRTWGYTETGSLWCTDCHGSLMVTVPGHDFHPDYDCESPSPHRHMCETCES